MISPVCRLKGVRTGDGRCGRWATTTKRSTPNMFPELFSVAGKTALITGGTRGIGYMIAEGYLRAGVRVYISSRKPDACEMAEQELSRMGAVQALPASG